MLYTREELLSRTLREGECLIWQGAKAGKGYAVVSDDRDRYVHRLILLTDEGPIPPGVQVAHKCGRQDCINPEHLYKATQSENEADKKKHGRYNHGKPGVSHCGKYLMPELGPKSSRCRREASHQGPCKPDIFEATYERVGLRGDFDD